ncbi:unnamed protein product [Camellia sinensis]
MDLKNLPLIYSYNSIQSLAKNINKSDTEHDLVIASYVLREIASPQDKISIVRQLWDLSTFHVSVCASLRAEECMDDVEQYEEIASDCMDIKRERWALTEEGRTYVAAGSPELQVFSAIPPEGISPKQLQMPSLRIIYTRADPGSGCGRIIHTPIRRGKRVEMDVC